MTIFGIDPGIGRVGWGVIREDGSKLKFVDFGCFETSSHDSTEERLVDIHEFLKNKFLEVNPDSVAVEELFFSSNAKTAFTVGQARGVILLTASILGIPVSSYTPLQVKSSVTGYGKAAKDQVARMVQALLKLPDTPCQDDAADALAIAITHAFSYKLDSKIKTLKLKENL